MYSIEMKNAATVVASKVGIQKASDILGVTYPTIKDWCDRAGVEPLKVQVRKALNLEPYTVAEYYQCHTGVDTAKHFGTTPNHVQQLVIKARKKDPTIFTYQLHNGPSQEVTYDA